MDEVKGRSNVRKKYYLVYRGSRLVVDLVRKVLKLWHRKQA